MSQSSASASQWVTIKLKVWIHLMDSNKYDEHNVFKSIGLVYIRSFIHRFSIHREYFPIIQYYSVDLGRYVYIYW